MKSKNGFTTVELMVTVMIMAITLTLAAPSFTSAIHDNRMTGEINGFVALMNYARSEAIKRGSQVSICPRNPAGNACTTAWESGLLVFVDANANSALDAGDTVLRLSDGITGNNTLNALRQGTSTPVNVMGYLSSGNSANTFAIDFTLCDPTTHKSRVMSLSIVGHLTTSSLTC